MIDEMKPDSLKVTVKSLESVDDEYRFKVRLSNKANRALHYICDVRTTKYDPQTKTVTFSLSDEGREVIPGVISKLPEFRYVDPESDIDIELRVPSRVVKLSRSAPPGQLAFESHDLSEAENVVVEIAWADIPYYKDTRELKEDGRLPAARWQQHVARTSKKLQHKKSKKKK